MILALDLSSKSSGVCVGDNKEIIHYECIAAGSTILEKRIITMRNRIAEIIKEYNIDEIIIEEVRTDYSNSHTYKVLTWLQGVVAIAAYEINPKIKIQYIQASSWRSKIGIKTGAGVKREELKQKDIEFVKEKYNLNVNDDIADAIGIYTSYITQDDCAW